MIVVSFANRSAYVLVVCVMDTLVENALSECNAILATDSTQQFFTTSTGTQGKIILMYNH